MPEYQQVGDNELFRMLVEAVHDQAIFVVDLEGCVRSWNPGAERLLGYAQDEIIGQPAALFFTPEDIEGGVPQLEMGKAVATGRGDDDHCQVRKDGSRFWSCGTITPLWDEKRNLRGFARVMRDSTSLAHEDIALKDALTYAQGVVETVREPLLVLGADLRVKSANRAFYQTFRSTPGETEGRLVFQLGNHQWDIPALRTLLEDILPRDTAFDGFEVEHEFGAIGRKVMLLNAQRFRQEGNQTELILLAMEDITARRRAEEERWAIETRFTSLVKNIKDHAIFTLDLGGLITSWNVEAERILGYSEGEILGQPFSIIFPPEDNQTNVPARELRQATELGRAEDERWLVRKDGERFWALGIVTPTHDSRGAPTGYSKILRDMTVRKQAATKLQLAHDEADMDLVERTVELRTATEGLQKEIDDRKLAALRLDAQHTTTRVLAGSRNLKTALPHVLQAVSLSLGAVWASAWMVDEQGERLDVADSWSSPLASVELVAGCARETVLSGEGLPGRAWATGEPEWAPDAMQDFIAQRMTDSDARALGAVAFPILRGRDVIGVVELVGESIVRPDQALLRMMANIGSQIGQFVDQGQTETALDKEQKFLRAVLENVQDGIVACDSNGKLAFFNRAARELYADAAKPLAAGALAWD